MEYMFSHEALFSAIGGRFIKNREDSPVTSLCYDSRDCIPGCAFFAFSGTHGSGSSYIDEAVQNGAELIITDRECGNTGADYIITDGNIRSLYAFSSYLFFGRVSDRLRIIGVTGTDGKTSTCFYIYQLLKACGFRAGLITTVYIDDGSGLVRSPYPNTTPEAFHIHSILSRACENNVDYFIIEATSHALSSQFDRLNSIRYSSCVYTKVSSEHLEFHKTLENYYNAKLNLARRCTGETFIYRDNVLASAMEKENTVFLDHPVIAKAEEDRLFFSENGKMYIFPHPEDFALDNAFLAAAAVRNETGLSEDEILSHMKELENPEGRCETLLIGSRIIVIDFAHTPDAFSALFSSFRKIYPSRGFITVFGASGCRDATKRPHMGHEAAKASRAVIITEDDPREEGFQKISRDILSGIKDTQAEVFVIEKREDALRKAFQISDENDIIFSLGLGAQKSIDYHTHRRSWSEREEIMKAAKEVLV